MTLFSKLNDNGSAFPPINLHIFTSSPWSSARPAFVVSTECAVSPGKPSKIPSDSVRDSMRKEGSKAACSRTPVTFAHFGIVGKDPDQSCMSCAQRLDAINSKTLDLLDKKGCVKKRSYPVQIFYDIICYITIFMCLQVLL